MEDYQRSEQSQQILNCQLFSLEMAVCFILYLLLFHEDFVNISNYKTFDTSIHA